MKRALILVNSYFPKGAAISSRILNFCRLLRDAGFKVHVIAGYAKEQKVVCDKILEIEGITYEVVSAKPGSALESFIGIPGFVNKVKTYLQSNQTDVIFMTSSVAMYRKLQRVFKTHDIKYFVEQCEWMDVSSYKFGRLDLRYLQTAYLRRTGFCHPTGIVSISRLLDEYYNSLGVKSIRIPTILDIQNTCFQTETKYDNNKIHIVFAGSLGGTKELMSPIIEALATNEEFRSRIQFDVYGPNREQIIKNLGKKADSLKLAGESVVIHGRIPQDEVAEVYSNSDYLIFVRPQRRSSDAGFPTKFAESMAVGTPVITNNTGDIGLYLQDGKNGFMLTDNTTEAVCNCFEKLIVMNKERYKEMRKAARKTAEECFDYKNYIQLLLDFLGTDKKAEDNGRK